VLGQKAFLFPNRLIWFLSKDD